MFVILLIFRGNASESPYVQPELKNSKRASEKENKKVTAEMTETGLSSRKECAQDAVSNEQSSDHPD